MTTIDSSRTDAEASTPSRTPLFAALGIGAALVLTAVATFWDVTGNDSAGNDQADTYPFVVGIVAVTAAIAYGLVVRTAAKGAPGRRSLITAVVAFLSLAAFWSGVPVVLASASVACALVDKDRRGALGGQAKVATALAALTVVLAAVLSIVG